MTRVNNSRPRPGKGLKGRQSTMATPFTSTTSPTSESPETSDIINCLAIYYEKGRSGAKRVKMGLRDLRDSHCISVVLIKAFSVLP